MCFLGARHTGCNGPRHLVVSEQLRWIPIVYINIRPTVFFMLLDLRTSSSRTKALVAFIATSNTFGFPDRMPCEMSDLPHKSLAISRFRACIARAADRVAIAVAVRATSGGFRCVGPEHLPVRNIRLPISTPCTSGGGKRVMMTFCRVKREWSTLR